MIARLSARSLSSCLRPGFAFSSSASTIDYYTLLGISRGATQPEIKSAFRRLTSQITPENNPALFGRLNEAFVILMDNKARDAYDSLVRTSRVSSLFNNEKPKASSPNSYLQDRKEDRQREFLKANNLDKFGRYKGGVPRRNLNKARGNAQEPPGTLFDNSDAYDQDKNPEYIQVDGQRAESFKNFHQDERAARTLKPTWTSFEVDYNYFFPNAYSAGWRFTRYLVGILFCLPILLEFNIGLYKRFLHDEAEKKHQAKLEHARKEAEEKRLAEEKEQAEKAAAAAVTEE